MEVKKVMILTKNKWLYTTLLTLSIVFLLIQPSTSRAQTFDTIAESAIIVDTDTGNILYAKNETEALPPASMIKMMTEYIVLEKIANGELSWDTTTQISDYAYSISANPSFSGVGLRQNVEYTVRELYEAMAINSDNATTVALAELIAGTEGEFVKLMNAKAEEMGFPQGEYKIVNSTGLENSSLDGNHPEGTNADDTNLLSAQSAAILAYHLVNDYPEVLDISSVPSTEFDGQEIRNWNWMLNHDTDFLKHLYYEGVDGLKTGYTDLAGYCFTSTAKKGDKRLITVVMKTSSEEERFQETAKLLDYGFNSFEQTEIFEAGYKLEDNPNIPVTKGKKESVDVALGEAISIPIQKNSEERYSVQFEIDESLLNEEGALEAPITKGDIVGQAILQFDDEAYYGNVLDREKPLAVDLVAAEDVEKKNWFSLMLSSIGDFFKNLF